LPFSQNVKSTPAVSFGRVTKEKAEKVWESESASETQQREEEKVFPFLALHQL